MKTNNRKEGRERSDWEDNWEQITNEATNLKKLKKQRREKYKTKNQKHYHLDDDHLLEIDLDNWDLD